MGQGECILSTNRMILINNNPNNEFKAFDLPL